MKEWPFQSALSFTFSVFPLIYKIILVLHFMNLKMLLLQIDGIVALRIIDRGIFDGRTLKKYHAHL